MLLVGDYRLAVVTEGLGEPTVTSDAICGEARVTAGQPALLTVVGTEAEPVHVPTGMRSASALTGRSTRGGTGRLAPATTAAGRTWCCAVHWS